MEDIQDTQATLHIRLAGWIGSLSPTVRVFIDGECVGIVEDKLGRLFLLAPGVRKVMVKVNAMESDVWDISMSAGSLVALECGFHQWAIISFCLINSMLLATPISNSLGLPLVSFGISLGVAALMIVWFWSFFTPGCYIFLRTQTARLAPGARMPRVVRRPQMTIWKGMIVVAVIAGLLAVVVQDRIRQRRAEYEIERDRFQFLADLNAKSESIFAESDREIARLEREATQSMTLLSESVHSNPDDLELRRKFEKEKQDVEAIRALVANGVRKTAYYAQLKEKYLKAAARPWEAVEADPPPPP